MPVTGVAARKSALPLRRTLTQLGIPCSAFYVYCEAYQARRRGLEDGPSAQRRVWTNPRTGG
jgi:hypothetical protein